MEILENKNLISNIMKVVVAVYKSHEEAIDAIKTLGESKFPLKQVSLIGRVELIDDQMRLKSLDPVKNAPILIGSIAGPVLGLLTGLGVFVIPGFGFLYGAGAIIGIIGGFDLGVVSGGLLTLLATFGIKKKSILSYEESISKGNFLVIIQGNQQEINQAEYILHTEGKHIQYDQIVQEYIDTKTNMKELKKNGFVYNDYT